MRVIHDRTLPIRLRPEGVLPCAELGLLSVITREGHLWLYRTDGQRVWSFPLKAGQGAVKTCFSADGRLISAAFKGGGVRVYDLQQGKIISEGSGWPFSEQVVALCAHQVKSKAEKLAPLVDVSEALPNLPPLTSALSKNLTTRAGLDTLQGHGVNDIATVIGDGGTIELTLNGVFRVGGVRVPPGVKANDIHRFNNEYVLVGDRIGRLCTVPLQTTFLEDPFFCDAAGIVAKLAVLCAYVGEVARGLDEDTTSFIDFSRTLTNNLENNVKLEPVAAFYEVLLTGMMSTGLKTWLDEVGEKNIKKWARMANTCVDQLKGKFFGMILPAAERMVVLSGELKALVETRVGNLYGLDGQMVEYVIQSTCEFIKTTYLFLESVNNGANGFNCFADWLAVIAVALREGEEGVGDWSVGEVAKYISQNGFLKDFFVRNLNSVLESWAVAESRFDATYESFSEGSKDGVRLGPVKMIEGCQDADILASGVWKNGVWGAAYSRLGLEIWGRGDLIKIDLQERLMGFEVVDIQVGEEEVFILGTKKESECLGILRVMKGEKIDVFEGFDAERLRLYETGRTRTFAAVGRTSDLKDTVVVVGENRFAVVELD